MNPLLASVAEPPIAEAHSWIAGRTFPPEKPLIDVAQAVSADHPEALRLMERDVRNFSKFLGRLGYAVEPAEFLEAVGGKTIGPPPAEA